jgi:hypothetical protein
MKQDQYKPLPHEVVKQEDAVEKYFCIPFEKSPRHPMDEENSEFLIKLLLADREFELPEEEKPFLVKLIEKRLKYGMTYKIKDSRLILFLAILARNAGSAVMYMTYLQYWCKKKHVIEIDLNRFCEEIFPMGFPSEDDLHKIWDGQKVMRESSGASDNLVDYQSAMTSIQFLAPVQA